THRNRAPWPHGGRVRLSQSNTHTEIPTVENQQRKLEADSERLVRAFPVAGENDRPKTPCRPKIRRAIWDLHIDSADPLTSFCGSARLNNHPRLSSIGHSREVESYGGDFSSLLASIPTVRRHRCRAAAGSWS